MRQIISASRRTDIPAFYGDWFINRLKEGFAGLVNPFGGQKYFVSLRQADVACFVFWSKNLAPFVNKLKVIEQMGYNFYFNCTITALPGVFESNVDKQAAIEALKKISRMYSAEHINWRYDPIIISSVSDYDFHVRNFENIAAELAGCVRRCYFSFMVEYAKVKRNCAEFEKNYGIKVLQTDKELRVKLANELAEIAAGYGIEMFSCCGDYLIGPRIKKAHCIDGGIVQQLFGLDEWSYSPKPTREQCGCTESTDIGAYDTCPHGCVYCYANSNKRKARLVYNRHDVNCAFLGFTSSEAANWLTDSSLKK